jgi:DNA invertase Pin-like site-specific DNA recombinase
MPTDGQTLASQDAQLHAAGCAKVYSEKASGARTDRPELAKLLRRLNPPYLTYDHYPVVARCKIPWLSRIVTGQGSRRLFI